METKVIEFIKGLMQPAITVVILWQFVSMVQTGRIDPENVWQLTIGILAYWLGDRFINKYVKGKTEEPPKADGGAAANGAAAAPAPDAPVAEHEPQSVYVQPTDPKSFVFDKPTAYERWNQFENLRNTIDLTLFDPAIRLDYADLFELSELSRLDEAWVEEIKSAGYPDLPKPGITDLADNAAVNAFKKKLMDIIPGCQWLPAIFGMLITAYRKVYQTQAQIKELRGKQVNWNFISTIEGIRREGSLAIMP